MARRTSAFRALAAYREGMNTLTLNGQPVGGRALLEALHPGGQRIWAAITVATVFGLCSSCSRRRTALNSQLNGSSFTASV